MHTPNVHKHEWTLDDGLKCNVTSQEDDELKMQQLLFEQGRLANRGAADLTLLYIGICKGAFTVQAAPSSTPRNAHFSLVRICDSAYYYQLNQLLPVMECTVQYSCSCSFSATGEPSEMLQRTILLGISLLQEGNNDVQKVLFSRC